MEDDGLERLVNNPTFWNLREPVALFFSYIDSDRYERAMRDNDYLTQYYYVNQERLIAHLRKYNFPTVSEYDIRSQDPRTLLVTQTGIQTPFYPQEKAREYALRILKAIQDSGFCRPLSHVNAIRAKQLPIPVIQTGKQLKEFGFLTHPNGALQDYILKKYGADFIDRKLQEAFRQSYPIDDLSLENMNLLFAGRQLGKEHHYSYPYNGLEGRSVVYATKKVGYALDRTGYDKTGNFGYLHIWKEISGQTYYADYGSERGVMISSHEADKHETMINANANIYIGVAIHFGNRIFMIPDGDPEWEGFKEYFRAPFYTNNENLKNRRINVLVEAKENGGEGKVDIISSEELDEIKINQEKNKEVKLSDMIIGQVPTIVEEYEKEYEQEQKAMINRLNTQRRIVHDIREKERREESIQTLQELTIKVRQSRQNKQTPSSNKATNKQIADIVDSISKKR